ncbi:MAG: IS1595 family transposase [Candidatus Gracilibacteria bacterium]
MNIIQIYKQFPTEESCLKHLEKVRWEGRPTCPYCKSQKQTPMEKEFRYHCNTCNTSYSVTVGTIFHKTHLDLQKWFLAISLILNAYKGVSARQLARDLEVNKNTAWYMAMRVRNAMIEQRELLTGVVEMDETYIGGKRKGPRGRGALGKTPVVGMVARGGKIVAKRVFKVNAKVLTSLVREKVNLSEATMMTDEFKGYTRLKNFIPHKTINHSKWYVDGDTHTNTIEGFWSLLKRGIVGQFHKVSAHRLPKYIDEFCFRYNHRGETDVFETLLLKSVTL